MATATDAEVIRHADGRVELREGAEQEIRRSPLYNEDLAPVPVERRTWTTYNYAALWISMAHCIPTYMMASGLISAGMNWWQALITILLGNIIVLAPILLNSHPGTKYGIPFPVFARAAYGTVGSNLPAIMRAIVACGWFGIQAWIGGQAINVLMKAIVPGWHTLLGSGFGGHTTTEWLSFLVFWAMNIYIIYRGMDLLRHVENWAAPFVLVMTALLVAWAVWRADGLGHILTQPTRFKSLGEFWPIFIPSLTAMIGFWATLSLNMPDFTRFGRSQREQAVGQVVALPSTMTVFAAMGVLITSAAMVIYPDMAAGDVWDPVKLVGRFEHPVIVAVSMFTVVVATLSVNIAANVVSPANDFANAFPRLISFRLGGLITGIIGILMQPWRLLADPSGYIFSWLLGYSGGLGSIAGVLIADYWLTRNKKLSLADLYRQQGVYTYAKRWNLLIKVVIVTSFGLIGFALAWDFDLIRLGWGELFKMQTISSFLIALERSVEAALLIAFFCLLGLLLTLERGWNWRAVAATYIGCAFAWIGLLMPNVTIPILEINLRVLYDYAWFVGFGTAFVTHLALMKLARPRETDVTDASHAAVVAGE